MIERLKNILPKIIKIKDDKAPFIRNMDKVEDSKTNEAPKSIFTT